MTAQTQTMAPFNGAIFAASVAGLAACAIVSAIGLITQGHAAFNTTNDGVPWGLPVATYVFFVLMSTGLTLIASFAMVFGFKGYYPVAKRLVWLAAATIIAGFASLALELGHPFRMLWALPLSFQYKSPMNWMGIFYTLYLLFLLLKFQRMNAGDWDSGLSRKLGLASFVSVVIAHGTLGLVFGMMAMRPAWFDGYMPIYFLGTAFLSGIAAAVLITHIAYGFKLDAMPEGVRTLMTGAMPKLFLAVLGIVNLFIIARVITGLWSNAEGLQIFDHQVRSVWFWVEGIALVGAFVALLDEDMRRSVNVQVGAAAAVMVALFIGRYEYVIGGQLLPLLKGNWVPGLIDYVPSLTEWTIALLAIFLAFAIYAVGERWLNLGAEPKR